MERQLRKNQDTLYISGMAVIAFGLWSIVKGILSSLAADGYLATIGLDPENKALLVATFVLLALILAAGIFVRIKVGIGAVNEARGDKRGYGYIIVAACLFIPSSAAGIFSYVTENAMTSANIVAILVEATSMAATIEMIVSALKVKKLTREKEG